LIAEAAADAGGVDSDCLAELLFALDQGAALPRWQGPRVGGGEQAVQLSLGATGLDAAAQGGNTAFALVDLAVELAVAVGPEPGVADHLQGNEQGEHKGPAAGQLMAAPAAGPGFIGVAVEQDIAQTQHHHRQQQHRCEVDGGI
jgi:hypothetical protein